MLSDLDRLYIRGEYTNGVDSMLLDNVVLVPAPGAMTLARGAALLAGFRRRRRG